MVDVSPVAGSAVVTGGTGAIGAAVCRRLLASGHNVAFTYRHNSAAAAEIQREAALLGRVASATSVDLTDARAAADFVERAHARLGAVHVFVHAAGPFVPQSFISRVTPNQMTEHLLAETGAFFNVASPLLPMLRESSGAIAAVTTVAVRRFPTRDGLSPAAKAGIETLVRTIAAEEGRFGVRANCVGPGLLSEGIAADLTEAGQFGVEAQEHARRLIPMRRFGLAEEVAAVVTFLVSTEASYVSGQTLDVDGGYSI